MYKYVNYCTAEHVCIPFPTRFCLLEERNGNFRFRHTLWNIRNDRRRNETRFDIITCRVVRATKMTGSNLGDWIY
jgi:hypothetical protein